MPTTQFTFNVGVNPGYDHNNEVIHPLISACSAWKEEAEAVAAEGWMYVAAVAQQAVTIYPKQFGCPDGGEDTVVFTGLLNTHFNKGPNDRVMYLIAVEKVCRRVARRLGQTTGYLSWSTVEFCYILVD